MTWFKDLIGRVASETAEDLCFVEGLKIHGQDKTEFSASEQRSLTPDECYIELYVDSLRIEKARVFATRFHGIVYSFVKLARLGETTPLIAAVTKPARLADLDASSVGRVITVSRKMMGPIAWRGGELDIELGLFSIKSGNLLTPVINFVTKISDAAGVAFVGSARPFIPLITEGMDLIAGQTSDARLEVGIDSVVRVERPTIFAVIAAPRASIDINTLAVDPSDRKLLSNGTPLQWGYCVFSIRSTDQRPDFGDIPELRTSYTTLREAVIAGKAGPAREALAAFRRATIASPDLISSDAARLVKIADKMVSDALAPSRLKFAGKDTGDAGARAPVQSLKDLPLYPSVPVV